MIEKLAVDMEMISNPTYEKMFAKINELVDEENATVASIQATNMRITKLKKDFEDFKTAQRNLG